MTDTLTPLPDRLSQYGWTLERAQQFTPFTDSNLEPARVVCELRRKFYAVQTASDEVLAQCPGSFFHNTLSTDQFPSIGDWVAIKRRPNESRAEIHTILPRTTKFSRRAAGHNNTEQIIAANIDTIFLISSLDNSFNLQRIQRFLSAANESSAQTVILLNKADLADNPDALLAQTQSIAPDTSVFLISAKTRRNLKSLNSFLSPGTTSIFFGSSGVGKSTLINRLLKEQLLPTIEVREKDSKGRHTTTRRELFLAPNGAILIDTPGMRELQLWNPSHGIDKSFADIIQLTARCKFSNCSHTTEPHCAIQTALQNNTLLLDRWQSYQKLLAEKPKLNNNPKSNNRLKYQKLHRESDNWKKHHL